jgi:hypothetical protein
MLWPGIEDDLAGEPKRKRKGYAKHHAASKALEITNHVRTPMLRVIAKYPALRHV